MEFRLKEFRQAHKLFQSDMAEILGENQSSISRKELRNSCNLTVIQKKTLYDRFGKEDVDAFMDIENQNGEESKNVIGTHKDDSCENKGVYQGKCESSYIAIIKQQSEALTKLSWRMSEQNDRLIALIEKISEKL